MPRVKGRSWPEIVYLDEEKTIYKTNVTKGGNKSLKILIPKTIRDMFPYNTRVKVTIEKIEAKEK